MKHFIGRKRELEFLERAYASQDSQFIPIYGRRRVGKSELILQFIKDKPAVYYTGKKAGEEIQVQEFLGSAAIELNVPLLAETTITTWFRALDEVVQRWQGAEKLIIVLDEFQWIAEYSEALTSHLQELWDRVWQHSGRLMLILCGSYIGFMEREILGAKSPLFGRRSGQILLQGFDYREASLFHPAYGSVDHARTYFICGGIPYYLRCFDDGLSVEENIKASLLSQFSVLFREPDFLLREELREVEKYNTILYTLGSTSARATELSRRTDITRGSIDYYLKQLIELHYIERRQSLEPRPRRRPRTLYRISDPLLKFWFTFVYPNASHLARVGHQRLFTDRIRSELPRYFGLCFEGLCREALPLLYLREGVSADFQVGEYWGKHSQIDVLGVRQDNWIDVGECKWGRIPSLKALIAEVEAKVRALPNEDNATIGCRLFTRQATKQASLPGRWSWHSLQDLYAL